MPFSVVVNLGDCPCCEGNCCGKGGVAALVMVVTNRTGACTCVDGEVEMSGPGEGQFPVWGGTLGPGCANPSGIAVRCEDGEWLLDGSNLGVDIPATSVSCNPFQVVWEGLNGSGICSPPTAGTFDLTLTEPA